MRHRMQALVSSKYITAMSQRVHPPQFDSEYIPLPISVWIKSENSAHHALSGERHMEEWIEKLILRLPFLQS